MMFVHNFHPCVFAGVFVTVHLLYGYKYVHACMYYARKHVFVLFAYKHLHLYLCVRIFLICYIHIYTYVHCLIPDGHMCTHSMYVRIFCIVSTYVCCTIGTFRGWVILLLHCSSWWFPSATKRPLSWLR